MTLTILRALISVVFITICGDNCFVNCLTDEQRQEFTDLHNHLRRSVVPYASKMQELVYNKTIESIVQKHLEKCIFDHRGKDGFGENGRRSTDAKIVNSVMSWFQERVWYEPSKPWNLRCAKSHSNKEFMSTVQCGHYLMTAKDTLVQLGCATKFCKETKDKNGKITKNRYLSFCFYDSGAKNPPYSTGSWCDSCDPGYEYCSSNMCVKKNVNSKLRRTCKNCRPRMQHLCDCTNTESDTCELDKPDRSCSKCGREGKKCVNGQDTGDINKCSCKCKAGFEGELCDILKIERENSATIKIHGKRWNYDMMIPVNVAQFQQSFDELQRIIPDAIAHQCKGSSDDSCKQLEEPHKATLVKIDPLMKLYKSGEVDIVLAYKYEIISSKKRGYLTPSILMNVFNDPTKELKAYIERMRDFRITGSKQTTKIPVKITQRSTKSSSSTKSTGSIKPSAATKSTG